MILQCQNQIRGSLFEDSIIFFSATVSHNQVMTLLDLESLEMDLESLELDYLDLRKIKEVNVC